MVLKLKHIAVILFGLSSYAIAATPETSDKNDGIFSPNIKQLLKDSASYYGELNTQNRQDGQSTLDLEQVFILALQNDSQWLASQYENQASQEEPNLARAALLPRVSLNASVLRNNNRVTYPGRDVFGNSTGEQTTRTNYTSQNVTLGVSQALYRPQAYTNFQQSKVKVSYADIQLQKQRFDLISRIAEAYFNHLYQVERYQLSLAERTSYEAILEQNTHGFKAGTATLTDISEARSRRDLAVAQLVEASNAVEHSRQQLSSIINQPIQQLLAVSPDKLPLDALSPQTLAEWMELANQHSLDILAAKQELEMSRLEVEKAREGHHPTLDLVAQRQRLENDTLNNNNQTQNNTIIGVQLNVPIYLGGETNAQIRQTASRLDMTQQKLENAVRQTKLSIEQSYLSAIQSVNQIRAYSVAVDSAKESFMATRKGVEAGTRTTVDILNAERQVFDAKQSLSRARYQYILSIIGLKTQSGTMTDDDIHTINRWLDQSR